MEKVRRSTPYEEAAEVYRPKRARILFIAEAPPTAVERYFYYPHVAKQDSLWVELTKALYPNDFGETKEERVRKAQWLRRFQGCGYQLIDAVKQPISGTDKQRVKLISSHCTELVSEVVAVRPDQIVLIKLSVYEGLTEAFRAAGLPVVNDGPLPFPGSGQQTKFHELFRSLVKHGRLALSPNC